MSTEQHSPLAFTQIPDTEKVAAAIDLNGAWQFKATDESVWLDACVPSTVHSDLIRGGRLEEPFYRDNEFKAQWVEKKEWEYRRAFRVDESFLAHGAIVLDCRGLDTIAEIYVNGSLVARTRNMFVEYEFDVKSLLRVGENEIHIVFRSILEWNKQQVAQEPRVIWEDEKGNYYCARKSGTDFGWNWGLRLLGCGIWRPIRLAAYNTARITALWVRQDLRDPNRAMIEVNAEIEHSSARELALEIQVLLDGKVVSQTTIPAASEKIQAQIAIDNPRLWWPNGWGEPTLYTVVATLKTSAANVHTRRIRIGLRTIELVQERDERGQTFGFKINGHLIFCKGANWIPAGALKDRLTVAHYRHLLSICQETHMNMLRVWAGGIYEPDCFYDLCDDLGIMLWHDFMFASGPYFANASYLENVRDEIANVVRRLRHHPSIVLWCGNNEQESDMPKWVEQWKTVTWEDFDRVFYETIPQTAAQHDPDRPYWPGSPHHPLDRKAQNSDYESASGDTHLWDVWHADQPFTWYVDHLDYRFVSEFGFYSLPTPETIRSFTVPEDCYFSSRILDLHNKTGRKSRRDEDLGNMTIARYAASMYRMPKGFENWVYLSQVMHGEGMKIAVEAYRRNYPHTTGALYWQLNENWPTISGSSLDYYGRWKALQYMARHFFNPILVCGWVEGAHIRIWGVNDFLHEMPGTLQWTLARFDGSEIERGTQDARLPANTSTLFAELDFERVVGENPTHATYRNTNYANRSQYYLAYRLVQGERVLSSNVSFFVPYKYLTLEPPRLKCELKQENGVWLVTVSAERFAAYVELGLKNGYARFSDNYFHLLPGETRRVQIVECGISAEQVRRQLYVKSLLDSFGERAGKAT
jgi:beta-mannosidase